MIKELINRIEKEYSGLDAIVVEGYDGVGKGTILNELSSYYDVIPYRPDYNLWQQFDHRNADRWKVSGFFWDIFSHFNNSSGSMSMLFDRGVISGAVYNDDMRIAENYKKLLRDMRVLHVLVVCSARDYYRFAKARNPETSDNDITEDWLRCEEFTNKYKRAFDIAGVDYIIYKNEYEEIPTDICRSCGHYSYGTCRHPSKNCKVDGDQKRCSLSNEREVQDIV